MIPMLLPFNGGRSFQAKNWQKNDVDKQRRKQHFLEEDYP
jgi:hypothetical protein